MHRIGERIQVYHFGPGRFVKVHRIENSDSLCQNLRKKDHLCTDIKLFRQISLHILCATTHALYGDVNGRTTEIP